MMKKVIHNEISAPTGAWKCYFPASGYREFTLPIIYFLFDCHKVPISDRQSQSMLILWTDKVIIIKL